MLMKIVLSLLVLLSFLLDDQHALADIPLSQLEAICGITHGLANNLPLWSVGMQGATGGRRFWRSSKAVRAATIKARADKDLSSAVVFELAKGAVVGQAGPCEFVDDILRLQIYEPVESTGEPRAGWVTLSAEQKGGPRFFVEVSASEVEDISKHVGLNHCTSALPGVDHLREIQRISNSIGQRACVGSDSGLVCGSSPSPAVGSSVVLNVAGGLWNQLFVPPHSEKLWLVVSFTPWCKRCTELVRTWELYARHSFGKSIHFAVLNCHASADFCTSLNLPGHPLVTAIYEGGDKDVRDAISSWNKERDSSANSWLPVNWNFGDVAKVASLLKVLPSSYSPSIAAVNHLPPVAQCARAKGITKLSKPQIDGVDVGESWLPDVSVLNTSDIVRDDSNLSLKAEASFPGALWAMLSSLEHTEGTSIGIRWLSAVELWLGAVERRIPEGLVALSRDLSELRNFVSAELGRTLVLGGKHAVCNLEWAIKLKPLQEAVWSSWPQEVLKNPQRCSSRCNAWALLHGLGNVNVSSTPLSGLDLLESLWALLAAEASVFGNSSFGGRGVGLHAALGSGEATSLLEAMAQGKYGLGDSIENPASWTNSTTALVLWRAHAAATAKASLACRTQGRAIPDLRWPPSKLCSECWRKCFRRNRFCWEPWEEQRRAVAFEEPEEVAFDDALPNDNEVIQFISRRYSWDSENRQASQ